MNSKELMELGEAKLVHTYNRFPVVLERGEGVYLYDADGKKYLDFGAGIAVFAFGYGNPYYGEALKDQIDRLIHTSNLFYNVPAVTAAARLTKLAGLDRVFFTNSGTEAIEGAIKLAEKYAWLKDQSKDHEIISMGRSFHGRSTGALSVTGNTKYQEAFSLIHGVRFAQYNNIQSVRELFSEKTCAIILETLQGEGGVRPVEKSFLQEIREICNERDILLILDEVQCGMGRTGKMFAWEHYGVKPDIMTLAKALGCGVPVGAFLASEKAAAAFVPGDHGSTYGGNPLACAAIGAVLDLFEKTDVLENVNRVGAYLEAGLKELAEQEADVLAWRGMGLIQGLELRETLSAGKICEKAVENGLILFTAEGNVLRFIPPLIISERDVDEMLRILKKTIREVKSR